MREKWGAQALRLCVLDHDWSRPPAGLAELVKGRSLEDLAKRACMHGVASFAYLSLCQLEGIDREALDQLESERMAGIGRHLRAMADLGKVQEILAPVEIPFLVIKGPVLSERFYPRPDLRSYWDLDLLVDRRYFRGAVEAFEARGLTLTDPNWNSLRRLESGQIHMKLPAGTLADIHWHILNPSGVRRSLSVPIDAIIQRAVPATLRGNEVRTLGRVDTLLHLCVHAALSGGIRLIWLKDIERVVATEPPGWDEFIEQAFAWKAAAPISSILARTKRFLKAEIPGEVIRQLSPSSTGRAADATFDLLWSSNLAIDRRSPTAYWMRYRRNSLKSSAAALVSHEIRRRVRLKSPRETMPDNSIPLRPVESDTEGRDPRQAFFDLVSAPSDPIEVQTQAPRDHPDPSADKFTMDPP